jgi:hypothetical protein
MTLIVKVTLIIDLSVRNHWPFPISRLVALTVALDHDCEMFVGDFSRRATETRKLRWGLITLCQNEPTNHFFKRTMEIWNRQTHEVGDFRGWFAMLELFEVRYSRFVGGWKCDLRGSLSWTAFWHPPSSLQQTTQRTTLETYDHTVITTFTTRQLHTQ